MKTPNKEFSDALKKLRLKFNLSQKVISHIADITQSDYSAFERQYRELSLNTANNISTKVWGVDYIKFLNFSEGIIEVDKLPLKTKEAVLESTFKNLRSTDNKLASQLDRLILEGAFNVHVTSKMLLGMMPPEFSNRNPSEVTNLLTKAPRNTYIISNKKIGNQKLFIHVDYLETEE